MGRIGRCAVRVVVASLLTLAGAIPRDNRVGADSSAPPLTVRAIGVAEGTSVVYVANSSGLYRAVAAPFSSWTVQTARGSIQAISPNSRNPDDLVYATRDAVYH